MGLIEIFFIALGLSMDAFAVSIMLGLTVKNLQIKHVLIPALFFGFFQAFMPLIGYFAGLHFSHHISGFAHWVAFCLLGFIGGKMIFDSFSKEEKYTKSHPYLFSTLLLLALATSIDALAVGITFSLFTLPVFVAIAIIGVTTFIISIVGVKIGNMFGTKYKSTAEFVGGAVLVLLGCKILIEGLFF